MYQYPSKWTIYANKCMLLKLKFSVDKSANRFHSKVIFRQCSVFWSHSLYTLLQLY